MLRLPTNRNDFIDFIRGLSILCVILLHTNIWLPFADSHLGQMVPHAISNISFHSGYYGVIIFFVVSGFLNTNTSIKRWGNLSRIRVIEFYQIRFARIIPSLIGLLIILTMLHLMSVDGFIIKTTTLENTLFAALTFHINWLEAKTGYLPAGWDVLWSLSVEEMFYLFFPIICLLTRGKLLFKIILSIFVIFGPIARCLYADNDIWAYHSYLSCMDGIAIGCLAAIYVNNVEIKRSASKFFLFSGLLLFILIFIFRHTTYQLGMTKIGVNVTILEIGIAFILVCVSNLKIYSGGWLITVFSWFGKNSYEIYLTHVLVIFSISCLFFTFKVSANLIPICYGCILFLSGLLGFIIATYFSEPINQFLRTKFVEINQKSLKNTEYTS